MNEPNNNNFDFFVKKISDKKIGLLFYLPAVFVALCFILFIALPIAQNQILNSLSVKLFDLPDHEISLFLPLLYGVFILIISLSIFPLSVALIKSNKAVNAGIATSFVCGIIVAILTALFSLKCEDIVLDLQYNTGIKLEKAGAVTSMEVGGYISAVAYLSFSAFVLLIKKGVIKIGQKNSSPSTQETVATPINNSTHSEQNNFTEVKELEELKKLLDAGVITQEEFDAKKKQILGL